MLTLMEMLLRSSSRMLEAHKGGDVDQVGSNENEVVPEFFENYAVQTNVHSILVASLQRP